MSHIGCQAGALRYPNEVLQAPMRRVCRRLREQGVDLARARALEFFAREGDWQTVSYAGQVASLEAWEMEPGCEAALRRNLPGARIRIGDSYQLAQRPEYAGVFDLVVLDNPQVIFGPQGEHCEHFEALELVPGLLGPVGTVIFNVNYAPYNYAQQPAWQQRRRAFYGRERTDRLDFEFLGTFYRQYFHRRGRETEFIFFEPRHEDVIAYAVMRVRAKTSDQAPGGSEPQGNQNLSWIKKTCS
jgi:hypothetical protein